MIVDEEDQTEDTPAEDTAGGEAESFDGDDAEEDGGNKKLFIIIGAVILLLIGGGAAAYFMGFIGGKSDSECVEEVDENGETVEVCPEEMEEKDGKDKKDQKGKKDAKGDKGEKGGAYGANFLEIPTMIVNLNTENGTPRYLRLTVQLELGSAADTEAVQAVIPRVVDQFQTYLRELRVRDLRGSAGIYRLQMELLWRVNQAAAPVEVKDILFQEILIQ